MKEALTNKDPDLKNIESRIKILKGRKDYRTGSGMDTSVMIEFPARR